MPLAFFHHFTTYVFKKIIQLDEKYLFKISQKVENNTNNLLELYPYAQITRNKKPDDLMGFYILHEGFIGVFDEELKEDDYDDVEDKKIASIGLRISKGKSYHGLSINIDMDLKPFSLINPCGYEGLEVTQISDFDSNVTLEDVKSVAIKEIQRIFS